MSDDSNTTGPGLMVLSWNPLPRPTSSLVGFCEVRLRNSLVLRDVAVHRGSAGAWVGMPSKLRTGRDGQPLRDPETGKARYEVIAEFTDRLVQREFGNRVLAALVESFPTARALLEPAMRLRSPEQPSLRLVEGGNA